MKTDKEIIAELKGLSDKSTKNLATLTGFGIKADNAWCISIPKLRKLAKELKIEPNRHELALALWQSNVHEARILAGFIDDPDKVTKTQLEEWVKDFDSWDTCDLVCGNLFDKTPYAYLKAEEWASRPEEFVKRAGFVLMATLAVHDKKATDDLFEKFLEIIVAQATDERNFVRKGVNWALRQIGKSRNSNLYYRALKTAYEIREIDDKTARWIAGDAIRELEKDYIKKRFFD